MTLYTVVRIAGQEIALLNDEPDPSLIELPVQCESLSGRLTYLAEEALLQTREQTGLPVYGVWQVFAEQILPVEAVGYITKEVRWFYMPASEGGPAISGDLNEEYKAVFPGLEVQLEFEHQSVKASRVMELPPPVLTPLELQAASRRNTRRMLAVAAITLAVVAGGFTAEYLARLYSSSSQRTAFLKLQQHQQSLQSQLQQMRRTRLTPNDPGHADWLAPLILLARDWPEVEVDGLNGNTAVASAVIRDRDARRIKHLVERVDWLSGWETLDNHRIRVQWQGQLQGNLP
ncbi:MAG: hypothetical protein JAZ11_02730 [Candidatus Thiodiazotropha lotti]|nr:hypothetical protein [Candidatus Thiodiazotropha lotti]